MTLIKCPVCGKKVSKNAKSCSNCGEPIKTKFNFTEIENRVNLGKGNFISLISFIILGVSVLFLFMPVYKSTYMRNYDYGSWIATGNIENINFFSGRSTDIFCHITLILLIVGIVTFVLMYMGDNKSFIKYTIFAPICALVSFLIETFQVVVWQKADQFSSYNEYAFGWGFYIIVSLLIVVSIISILIIIGKIDANKNLLKIKFKKSNDNLDELKKLKELLDMNAITEKEYNIKKKEILNLSKIKK